MKDACHVKVSTRLQLVSCARTFIACESVESQRVAPPYTDAARKGFAGLLVLRQHGTADLTKRGAAAEAQWAAGWPLKLDG